MDKALRGVFCFRPGLIFILNGRVVIKADGKWWLPLGNKFIKLGNWVYEGVKANGQRIVP